MQKHDKKKEAISKWGQDLHTDGNHSVAMIRQKQHFPDLMH